MQLVTFREHGTEQDRLGVLDDDHRIVDLTAVAVGEQPRTMLELLRAGRPGLDWAATVSQEAPRTGGTHRHVDEVRLRSPLPRPNSLRDFMLVEEHVRNSFGHIPDEWYEIPAYWKGNCDTVFGPEDTIPWPGYTDKLDYELEIGAIIGRPTFRVDIEQAAASIAGYTIFNDWSARDIQFREMKVGLGPGLGKDFASSLGPVMTTPDTVDITSAPMRARINGEIWSEGSVGAMRFSFPEVIAHLSQEQPLQPGDVLGSGTVGRGCGLELDRWLEPGDIVELEVEGIGVLRNQIGQKKAP